MKNVEVMKMALREKKITHFVFKKLSYSLSKQNDTQSIGYDIPSHVLLEREASLIASFISPRSTLYAHWLIIPNVASALTTSFNQTQTKIHTHTGLPAVILLSSQPL